MSEIKKGLLSQYKVGTVDVTLPTGGKFYENFQANMIGQVAVAPLQANEQLLLKSADALISGEAVEKIIEKCVPSIPNPRDVSVQDLDAIILGVKLASGDSTFSTAYSCPKCKKENEVEMDIRYLLDTIIPMDENNSVRLTDDLVAYIKPQSLGMATKIAMAHYTNMLAVNVATQEGISDSEIADLRNETFSKLSELRQESIVHCILKISTPEGETSDKEEISDFIKQNGKFFKMVEDKLDEFSKHGVLPDGMPIKCDNDKCNHEWNAPLIIDPSSFFD